MIQAALLSNWAFTPRCSETGTGRVKKDGEIPMSQTATASFDPRQRRQFGAALAILRIALGLFLLVWGLEKFIVRSEEHTSELQSLMRISYAVFCLKKKKQNNIQPHSLR